MRRSDREIVDENAINQFINKENIIRIALYDDGDIYIVPVNYGHCIEEGKHVFYFHGAKAGRKYELALKTPSVGFEIDGAWEYQQKMIDGVAVFRLEVDKLSCKAK